MMPPPPRNALKIVHYVPSLDLSKGGVARAVLDLCKVFADRGHDVSLITQDQKDIPQPWLDRQPGHPKSIMVPTGRYRDMTDADQKLFQNSDVLHLHGPWELTAYGLAKVARQHQIPYVISIHGMLDDWSMSQKAMKKRVFLLLAGRQFLNRAAAIHCTATAELSQARRWFSNPNTAVLPCLVDLASFENLPGPDLALPLLPEKARDRPKMLFLSRLHEKKGVDLLIRATGLLRDGGRECITMIAGVGDPDYEKLLRQLVERLRLQDRVFFLGMISGEQKVSLYQAADLFGLPTHQENFGLVLVEAMACGTPILTTKGTDIWEEIQKAGATIADRTASAFAELASNLLDDAAEREKRGKQGREWVFNHLAMQPLSERYEAMYRQISPDRGQGGMPQ